MDDKKLRKVYIFFGVILIFLGVFLLLSNYFLSKRQLAYDEISLALSSLPSNLDEDDIKEDPSSNKDDDKDKDDNKEEVPKEEKSIYETESMYDGLLSKNYYIGKLVIPKISFAKGFASIGSYQNDLNKNIAVIPQSSYPDVTNGNFILAGHSGRNYLSFFNNLDQLVNGDIAYVYYNGYKYTYTLVNVYREDRNPRLKIYRDQNKTTMTLITCSRHDNSKQLVLVFEQI